MSKIYKPIHYTKDNIEVIEFIEQVVQHYPAQEAYHIGNVLKYIARAPHKGNYIADLEKAENYLHRAIRGVWHE